MRVYVVRKWPLRGRSHVVCWNITRVSLWLLCNVHFVQSTQRTRLQTRTIRAWFKQFTETGCLCKQKLSGRPLTAKDDVERVDYRIDMCRVTRDANIEHLQLSKKKNQFSCGCEQFH